MNTVKVNKEKKTHDIDIYKTWCKACGICAAFCPTKVLARDEAGYPYVKDAEKCINCGWCEVRCPDFAISVNKRIMHERKSEEEPEEKREESSAPG